MAIAGCAGYLLNSIDPKQRRHFASEATTQIKMLMKRHGLKFDAIAVRGVSGMLVDVSISDRLDIPLIVVRKGETTHSSRYAEGIEHKRGLRYIIVDDCIDGGATVKAIHNTVASTHVEAKCVGIYLYAQDLTWTSDACARILRRFKCLNQGYYNKPVLSYCERDMTGEEIQNMLAKEQAEEEAQRAEEEIAF